MTVSDQRRSRQSDAVFFKNGRPDRAGADFCPTEILEKRAVFVFAAGQNLGIFGQMNIDLAEFVDATVQASEVLGTLSGFFLDLFLVDKLPPAGWEQIFRRRPVIFLLEGIAGALFLFQSPAIDLDKRRAGQMLLEDILLEKSTILQIFTFHVTRLPF